MFTPDYVAIANIMHLLVCGLHICYLPSGKALFHSKVKNSVYFADIKRLLDGKPLLNKTPVNALDLCPSMSEQFPHYNTLAVQLNMPTVISSCATKIGPLPSICFVGEYKGTLCVIHEHPSLGWHLQMNLVNDLRTVR
jgi:hypothetical protein